MERSRGAVLASWIAIWTGLALFFAVQGPMRVLPGGGPGMSWTESLATYLTFFWLWSVFALAVLVLSRERPILGEWRVWNLAVHVGAAMAISLAHLASFEVVRTVVWDRFPRDVPFAERLTLSIRNRIDLDLIIYFAVVVIAHLRRSDRAHRERAVAAAQLQEQLARAELGALRMQLHPHFLFNALNSVTALIHSDPEQAESMIVQLSRLLRRALETRDTNEVPLSREIELTRNYLELVSLRYGERLRYEIDVPAALGAALVPTFLLQPLVENAVVHGVDGGEDGGWITVRGRQQGDRLCLEVENGVPSESRRPSQPGARVGLENVQARLRHLYGEAAAFELDLEPGEKALARIVLPYREDGNEVPN